MTEKPADGVRGFLFYNSHLQRHVFRIYGEVDPATGHKSYKDYDLCAEGIEMTINSKTVSFYDDNEGHCYRLDYAQSLQGNRDFKDVPNLDDMYVDDLEAYDKTIQDKEGEVWDEVKEYVHCKTIAMQSRMDGNVNRAIRYERSCDMIYSRIKEYLDW